MPASTDNGRHWPLRSCIVLGAELRHRSILCIFLVTCVGGHMSADRLVVLPSDFKMASGSQRRCTATCLLRTSRLRTPSALQCVLFGNCRLSLVVFFCMVPPMLLHRRRPCFPACFHARFGACFLADSDSHVLPEWSVCSLALPFRCSPRSWHYRRVLCNGT